MADQKYSAGARTERQAVRNYLRRQVSIHGTNRAEGRVLQGALAWVLTRQKRYDKKPGGLGKK